MSNAKKLKNIEFQLIKRNSKGVVCPTVFEETISANILASHFQLPWAGRRAYGELLVKVVNTKVFKQFKHVEHFSCFGMGLEEMIPLHYWEKKLKVLEAHFNELTFENQSEFFLNLIHLNQLFLHKNKIKYLPNLKNCTNLTILTLSSNKLSSLKNCGLENLKELNKLEIEKNEINPNAMCCLSNLTKLIWLKLDWQNTIGLKIGEFNQLSFLSIFDGKKSQDKPSSSSMQNSFKYLPIDPRFKLIFDKITNVCSFLKSIQSFHQSKLRCLSINCVDKDHKQISIEYPLNANSIELRGWKFLSIDSLNHFDNITLIDLSYNRMEVLPLCDGPSQTLQSLNVSHNRLTSLDTLDFVNFSQLTSLQCNHNELRCLPDSINECRSLIQLDIDHNSQLQHLPFVGDLQHLQDFKIDHLRLKSLQHIGIESLNKLERLRLSHDLTFKDYTPFIFDPVLELVKRTPPLRIEFELNGKHLPDEYEEKFSKLRVRNNYIMELCQMYNVHPMLLDICIAMYPLDLPPYVLLEIFDFLPHMRWARHKAKIDLIIGVKKSANRIIANRQ